MPDLSQFIDPAVYQRIQQQAGGGDPNTPPQLAPQQPDVSQGGLPPAIQLGLLQQQQQDQPAAPQSPMATVPDEMEKLIESATKERTFAQTMLKGMLDNLQHPLQDPNAPKGMAGRALYNVLNGILSRVGYGRGAEYQIQQQQHQRQQQETAIQAMAQLLSSTNQQQMAAYQMANMQRLYAMMGISQQRANAATTNANANVTRTGLAQELAPFREQQMTANTAAAQSMPAYREALGNLANVRAQMLPMQLPPAQVQMVDAAQQEAKRIGMDPSQVKNMLQLPLDSRQNALLRFNAAYRAQHEFPDVAANRMASLVQKNLAITKLRAEADPNIAIPRGVELLTQDPNTWFQLQKTPFGPQVAQEFTKQYGVGVPQNKVTTAQQESLKVSDLSLRHIDIIRGLLADPGVRAAVGPVLGRVQSLEQFVGTPLTSTDPQVSQKLATLRGTMTPLVFQEMRQLVGARMAQQYMQEFKKTTPQWIMDPATILEGALKAVEQNANNNISSIRDSVYKAGPISPLKTGQVYPPGRGAPLPPNSLPVMPPKVTPPNTPPATPTVTKTFYDKNRVPHDFNLVNGQWQPK